MSVGSERTVGVGVWVYVCGIRVYSVCVWEWGCREDPR